MQTADYDIIVIGGGHAGIEAALASARLGRKTLMMTGNIEKMGNMPCNPSIGGPAKGTIVREIDALGGEMGKAADATLLQIKMLNGSKGPAVRALRVQSDKKAYSMYMRKVISETENLEVMETLVTKIIVKDGKVTGVTAGDKDISGRAVIVAGGTYLDSRILIGRRFWRSGPDHEKTTAELAKNLKELGLETIRLKTGTPPRIKKETVDFSKTKPEPGDNAFLKFSEETEKILPFEEHIPCYITHTTAETKKIIFENLDKSALYGGLVEGKGPRYCPSVEDKVVRFADKESHLVFLEPESGSFDEVYLQGLSTSMPEDVQLRLVRSLPGLEHAEIAKYAYAIEYDAINPLELKANLETKKIENLFFAGQVNGTSGYEEAACQGLMAGINADLKLKGKKPFVLRRDEAYIGVLIDDLITKGVRDPYRLMTSRAEFRLLLRHDNADERLTEYGHEFGLISEERYKKFLRKQKETTLLIEKLKRTKISPNSAFNGYLAGKGKQTVDIPVFAYDLIKRPDISFEDLEEYGGEKFPESSEAKEKAMIGIRYEGYIRKAYREAAKLKQMENRKIPADIDYGKIGNIAFEAVEKLNRVRPATLAQAERISGVNPVDAEMILIYLESGKMKHDGK